MARVIYATHDSQNVIVYCVHVSGAGPHALLELEVEGGVVDPGEVTRAGRLVLLGLEGEGVDVDAGRPGDVGVVLVGLHEVEVAAVLGVEAVVAVQLQLGFNQWVNLNTIYNGAVIGRVVRSRVHVRNDHPHDFLNWVIKIQPELVGARVDALGARELDLLYQIFVGDLRKPPALVCVEIDVVYPEGGVPEAAARHGHRAATRPGGLHQELR